MKVILTNKEIMEINNGFRILTNNQNDIKSKWYVSKKYLEIKELCEMVELNLRELVQKYGEKEENNENNDVKIPFDNKHIVEFFGLENELEVQGMKLSELSQLNTSMDDLVLLRKLIIDDLNN